MTSTMIPSADDTIVHDDRFVGAVHINDVIAAVVRERVGNIKRIALEADIPYQTLQSYLERQDDGSYRREPSGARLARLMAVNDDIMAGVLTLIRKQRAECQKR